MTAIDRVGPLASGRASARASGRPSGGPSGGPGAAGAGGFLPPAEPGGDAARAAAVATPDPVALDSLWALQLVDEPSERNRAARRHGQALLAALGSLQRSLLGDGGPATLAELRFLANAAPAAADPELADAVEMIVLRARIELQRRGG